VGVCRGHRDAAVVVARAGHHGDAAADGVLDLLGHEPLTRIAGVGIPGQAQVDDVGAVVHGPANPLAYVRHGAAAAGAEHSHGHDGHGPVEAGDADAVVGPGADDARHHSAVAERRSTVAIVGGRLVADEVAAGDDGARVDVGVVVPQPRVDDGHDYVGAARGDAPRVRGADERQAPLQGIVGVVGRHGQRDGVDPLVAPDRHDPGQRPEPLFDLFVGQAFVRDDQVVAVG